MDWIDLAQDRHRWWAFVNAPMKFRVHNMRGISLIAENRLASKEGLCSLE